MLEVTDRVLGYTRALTLITCALIVFFASAAVMTSVSIAPASANSGFVVGDTGPGGGTIFYVNHQGFPCGPDGSATCTYLEAAPSGWHGGGSDPSRTWSQSTPVNYQGTSVNNPTSPKTATATGIGMGYSNTRAIINQGSTDPATSAAALADAYTVTVSGVVYDDWYLPSSSELYEIWRQRNILGMNNSSAIFGADPYWSSSESNSSNAWYQRIYGEGDQWGTVSQVKSYSFYVRPVRALQGAPTVTTFSTATSTPRNDSNASYSVVFSQSVTGLASEDFENAGTATGCTFAVSGSGTTYTLTISNCSDGTIQPRLKANSVTGSIFVGPTTVATASTTITIDRVAPTATVTTATILATSNTSVQSSEIGTAYLVNETVSVTNLASITGASDNLWNSVAISTANTNTNLPATGLRSGTYKVYTVDAAGNLSAASTNTITIKPAAPGTPDLDAASDLGTSSTDNNTADDTPTFTVSSLETGAEVTLTATPASGSPMTCSFTASSTSGSCTFTAMPNGTYALTAVQVGSGISSDTSTALSNVVINKTTITAGTPDLAADSDKGEMSGNPHEVFGVSNSDDITNDNTPTINVSGSSSGTRTVTATKGGSSVSCTLSSGAYTCGTAQSPLADGVWSISVTDTDIAGNSATSAALSVTIDTVPPAEFGGTWEERVIVPPGTNIEIQVPEAGSAQLRNQSTYTTVKSALIPIAQANTSYTIQVPAANNDQCYYLYAYDVAGNQRQSRNFVVCTASAAAPRVGSEPYQPPSGTYRFGGTLSNAMTITGVPTPTVTYQYLRCRTGNLPDCVPIPGATSSTYTLTAADVGNHIGITVTATNSGGSDTQTTISGVAVGLDTPGVPTSVSATITGETTASVSFTEPTYNGGEAITDYDLEYSSNNGSTWTVFNNGTSTANPILVTGLTKNTSYIFRVKAKNRTRDGSFSTASSPQTTFEAPAVATNEGPSGTRTVGQTMTNLLTFSGVPTPTVSYQWVRCSSVSGSNWESTCVDIPNATATSYTLTDADFNHHMGVRATAVNSAGTNVRMAVRSGAVTAVAPGVPTSVSATITGATTATVSFTAPTSTGGAAITGYTVTSNPAGANCVVGVNATTYECTRLTPNTAYTFTVKATNSAGTGSSSQASSSVTTEAAPTLSVLKYDTNQNLRGPNDTPISIPSDWVTLTDPCANYSQYFSYSFSLADTCRSINGSAGEVRSPNLVLNNGNSASLTLNFVNPVSSFIFDVAAVDNQSPDQVHMLVFYDDSNPDSFYVGNSGFISHPITANGAASTRYQVSFPDGRPIKKIGLGFNSNGTGGTHDTIIFDNFSFVVAPLSATTSVSTKSLTLGTAATSFTPITASGGGSSKTYSISPSLPAGLSLNTSTGAITGTPSGASASTTYTVSVSDGSSTSSATFSLGVNAALSSTAGSVPSGVYKDVAVTAFTPISFSGGTSPISYAVSPSLPAGLTLNTSTGVISGTATGTAANTTYTVTATDANGDTEASTFAFAVTDAPTTPDAPTIGAATSTGQTTATVAFTAPANTGGAAITTYTVTASPGGITATGTSSPITVTGLTAGTAYTFSITATNAGGLTSSSSSPSSSITTSAATPSSGGGGGGGGSTAPEPDPEPSCNAACVAAKNVAAEKAAAEKAAAAEVAEKTKVDVATAAAQADTAVEKASTAAASKVEVDAVTAAINTVVRSAVSSKADTNKIKNDTKASLNSAPAAASTRSANIAAKRAAAEVIAAAAAGKAAAREVASTATISASELKAAAETMQRDATVAIAELNAEQKLANALAVEANNAAKIATAATAEKIAATSAAKNAAETLLALLTEKVALAEKAAVAETQESLDQLQQQIDLVNLKIADAEKALLETSSKAELAVNAQFQAVALAGTTKASVEAQLIKVEQLRTALPIKIQAAVRAISTAAVAKKVANAARNAARNASRIPLKAAIATNPGISTGKNSTRATISGLKPGQKVKVTVNVKPKP